MADALSSGRTKGLPKNLELVQTISKPCKVLKVAKCVSDARSCIMVKLQSEDLCY